ncbi:hypothetical protein [Streptomyces uncialis]|uniref:hypothetical protein n=1 Tax=Streptomyces uncialis TaxID=1048205 RepID=UPI003864E6C6|nr:hypothetical protein OG268_00615 [Streptomyces uncialis]
MSSTTARAWTVLAGGVCAVAAVTLVIVVTVTDLDTADRTVGVVGAVLSAFGLLTAVYGLVRGPAAAPERSGARSVTAAGSIGRAVTGDRNRVGTPPPPVPGTDPVAGTAPLADTAPAPRPPAGERAVDAGGDVAEAITGDGNRA